jgi:hypothetical protein
VCCEFWSPEKGRFVDIVIEETVDRPLVHASRGHRFVAIGVRGVADVRKRYTIDWEEALVARGREITEDDWPRTWRTSTR